MKNFVRGIAALIIALFVITAFSCTNVLETPLEESFSTDGETDTKKDSELKQVNKGGIMITLLQPENLEKSTENRTLLPDINLANLSSITLTGTKSGESTSHNLGSWSSASQISGVIELEEGLWNLALTASNSNFLFSDTKDVTITIGQNQNVSFVLNTSSTGGGIDFKINFSDNAQKLKYNLYRYNSGSFISVESNAAATINSESTGRSFTYQRNSSNPIQAGTYRLQLTFYGDSAGTILLNTYNEIINVKAGFISRSAERTINLNQMHSIVYKTEDGSSLDVSEYTIKDSLGNITTLPNNYSLYSGEITLPLLEKSGYIFEGWYTSDGSGNLSSSPVSAISATESGDKEFRAKFIIELKEGPDFNTIVKQWTAAEKFLPSATAPAVTPSYYLDTATNVPVWYDTVSHNVYFYCAGYTDSAGTKKLILRPDSSKLFQNARYSEINLSYFDTSRVTNMGYMFQNATQLYSINLSGFDTANVTDMNHMFAGASNLHEIYASDSFVTDSVTSDTYMFSSNSFLKGENNTAFTPANTGKDYARFDAAGSPGYFSHVPASTVYYITYELNNGTNAATNPASYTADDLPLVFSTPSRTGYTFDGWYTTSGFTEGTKITSIPAGSTGAYLLYAKWVANVDIDAVISQIQNAASGELVSISGAFTTDDFTSLCSAVKARTSAIGLDLSDVVGITTFANTYLNGAGSKVNHLVLPDGLTTIASTALHNLGSTSAPLSITIPKNVSSISNQAFFKGCISEILVDSDNQYFSSFNGCLYTKDYKTFKEHPYRKTGEITLKQGVEIIASQAFAARDTITQVNIPSSIKTIKANAFANIATSYTINISSLGAGSTLTFEARSFNQNNNEGCVTTINYLNTKAHFKAHVAFEDDWNSSCSNATNMFTFTDDNMTWADFMTYYNE